MNTKIFNTFYFTTTRLLKNNVLLYYLLHPVLLIITGYYLVGSPLPVLLKTGLFGLICLLTGWLFYRFLMVAGRQTDTALFKLPTFGSASKK